MAEESKGARLPLWQRLGITIVAMLAVSWLAGFLWREVVGLGFELPSFAAGAIGGLTALPIWDFLKRVRPGRG